MAKTKKRVVKKAGKKKPVILPRKMSSLIRIALRDIRKVENSNKFVIEMGSWFTPTEITCKTDNGAVISEYKSCAVCAAGSVMAFSLGASKKFNQELTPSEFTGNTSQLSAIDSLRVGEVHDASNELGIVISGDRSRFDTHVPEYDAMEPELFHKAMTKLQTRLAKAGY